MQWTDEGIVLGVQAPRGGECHRRADDARARPPSRPGAGRGGLAAAAGAAAGQSRQLRPGGRGSTSISAIYAVEALDSAAAACSGGGACGLWRDPSWRALPAAAGARSAPAHPCRAREVLDGSDRCPAGRAAMSCASSCSCSSELGFGLDLRRCAATGATDELVYVSPRAGRAVSRAGGRPWQDRLLPLAGVPRCVPSRRPSADDLADGFPLTGFFLRVMRSSRAGLRCRPNAASFVGAVLSACRPRNEPGAGRSAVPDSDRRVPG